MVIRLVFSYLPIQVVRGKEGVIIGPGKARVHLDMGHSMLLVLVAVEFPMLDDMGIFLFLIGNYDKGMIVGRESLLG